MTRAVILAALRRLGPSTALELQDATGISATTIRRYLVPPVVTLLAVEWTPTGRWTKRFMLTADFCDCGQPAAGAHPSGWARYAVVQLSADGKPRTEVLGLCPACVELLPPGERRKCRRMR